MAASRVRRRATHALLIEKILALCEQHGLQAWYWPDSRLVRRRGWPDLSVGGPGGWIFREVKTAYDSCSAEQLQAGYLMRAGGLDWAVWKPSDLASGWVECELRAIARNITVS